MVDIFISYARKDRDAVAQLAKALTAAGYDIWWDKELPPHKSYSDVITEKISEAAATIVVWSHDSVKSEWVRAEADFAREQKKLVQTALDDVMPPMPFNQIQFAQLGDWRGEGDHSGWTKVKASLAELCGRPGPKSADPAPPPSSAVMPPKAARWPLWAGGGMLTIAAALLAVNQLRAPGISPPKVAAPPTPAAVATVTPVSPARSAPQGAAAPVSTPATPVAEPASLAKAADKMQTVVAASAPVVPSEPSPVAVAVGTPPPPADDSPGISTGKAPAQVFPLSSARALNPRQVQGLSLERLQLARNEIFAHAGRLFRDKKLVAWFSQYHWYKPQAYEVTLNIFETQNVKLLDSAIEAQK